MRIPRPNSTAYDVLKVVVAWWETRSYGPSVDEVRELAGLKSKSTAQWHIERLADDELLSHVPGRHKSLRPTVKGQKLVELLEVKDASPQNQR